MVSKTQEIETLSEGQPWWRHRWPWLLALGPAVAVVGCVITIVLAFQAYGDQAIIDGGGRQGLVITAPAASTTQR
ncbi:MAG: hypothetical protein RBR29_07750 [Castellaniella sp.]|uniref:hypothetical protein n=1 Tax=Castellaniella sp. TaxID=1955812 RepID=UPI002A36E06D|nr:hypothetical protein [Castellaniella sp.]MDY0309667.1 hypothetical protein [Castellaniella sp.]